MQALSRVLTLSFLALLSFCVYAESAQVTLFSTEEKGAPRGGLFLEETPAGLRIQGAFSGLSSGSHAFHIHEFGLCGEQGKQAGGHYNPDGREHGNVLTQGSLHAHPGDLGNIQIDDNGMGQVDILVQGLALSHAEKTIGGRSFVVHAQADDFSQPAGNAGPRVACGIVVITQS